MFIRLINLNRLPTTTTPKGPSRRNYTCHRMHRNINTLPLRWCYYSFFKLITNVDEFIAKKPLNFFVLFRASKRLTLGRILSQFYWEATINNR